MTETKRTILLIDDEMSVHQHLPKLMGKRFKFYHARTAEAAMSRIGEYPIDVVLLDIELDADRPREGLRVLPQLKEKLGRTPIIVFTKFNDYNNVVDAMKLGAVDFFYKDEQDAVKWVREIEDAIKQSHQPSSNTSAQETSSTVVQNSDGFLGKSESVQKIKKILRKLSTKPNVSVLLTGETGVGKEIAAKYLHQHGVRKDKPFCTVHLSAITETVMESVLFGHKKGAFTDASKDRQGVFQEANGGILFLDEIGEINADIQTKLLRFLETKVIRPMGGQEITLDVQIVAATNRDLKVEVEKGAFRQDLYYRLNQFQIILPPLRERQEDINLLLDHYLHSSGDHAEVIAPEVREFLHRYSWPGNIRELVNWIKSATLKREINELPLIDESLLSDDMLSEKHGLDSHFSLSDEIDLSSDMNAEQIMYAKAAYAELQSVEEALLETKGRKGDAAAKLGMSADNLRYLVEKHFRRVPNLFQNFPKISERYKL